MKKGWRNKRKKLRCDKCHIELSEIFIQQNQFRIYRLCKNCNERYLKYMENIKKLEKINNLEIRRNDNE